MVYDGFSVTYAALQLAVYLGVQKFILLGVDCDYSQKVNHIKAYSSQPDINASNKMYHAFKYARKWADANGIQILNATRNAKMKAFDCVLLENLFEESRDK